MKIKYHKNFKKHYQQRIAPHTNLKKKFAQRLEQFLDNPNDPLPTLKKHRLTGAMKEFYSFSVTGDVRVIYRIEKDVIELYDVGSHNQVY